MAGEKVWGPGNNRTVAAGALMNSHGAFQVHLEDELRALSSSNIFFFNKKENGTSRSFSLSLTLFINKIKRTNLN